MTLHITFLTKFSGVSTTDTIKIAAACSHQLRYHAAPLWLRTAPVVTFAQDEAQLMPDAEPIYIFKDADQAGALGYHDLDTRGRPYAKVFAGTILDAGGGVLTGEYSVSATASHEALEMFGDPFCNDWSQANDGYSYAKELGDPVENDSYSYNGVALSNFVLPSYFAQNPEAGARFDYLGKLTAPFTMTAGGYLIRLKGGAVDQVYGESYPEWKLPGKTHPASRTARRAA